MRSKYDTAMEVINTILLEKLNEIRQNISFMKEELPSIDLSKDSEEINKLKQIIEDSLNRFGNKIYWEIEHLFLLRLKMMRPLKIKSFRKR